MQADLLLRSWRNDTEVQAALIPIDPDFPVFLRWAQQVPGLRTLIRFPLYGWNLWRGLRPADIAHIFSASYWSFLLAPLPAWAVARMLGKKTVIHYHSGEARDHLQRFRSARPVLAQADMLVVPSGYLVDVFREFDLRSQAIPNIVDLSQFSFRLRNQLRPSLVCTRGFHPYYSIDVVVKAFAEVKREFPEAELNLVGGGPTEPQIRELVKQLNLSGVNFAGVASWREINRFYDQADIFINASWLDNMPVSIMEAFASGTPVVTTSPECMPYVVEDGRTGLLSPVGNAHALADNVKKLLRDSDLAARLAQNAHQELQKYSWPVVRGQWLNVYRTILKETSAVPQELIGSDQ